MTERQIVSKDVVEKATEKLVEAKALIDSFDTDAQLDARINNLLESPEIDAMLENVAADAAEDAQNDLAKGDRIDALNMSLTIPGWTAHTITGPRNYVTTREFDEFKARVAAAFKHAGFKF